jgi:hypothetical protein
MDTTTKINFRELLNKYSKIVIPDIQRDYAQGREDKKSKEILEQFLNDLFTVLVGKKKYLHIDYIYGIVEEQDNNKKLIPIDGQQRLTTLFLLHIYLLSENLDFLITDNNSKFTYEIRSSSNEFCNFLVSSEITKIISENKRLSSPKEKISLKIKNHNKYRTFWDLDSTVLSMLSALDKIDSKYKEIKRLNLSIDIFKLNLIKFDYLDPKNLKFQRDLYLNMNSRGLALTDFEVNKARIEEFISTTPEFTKEFREEFSKKMDNEWADGFTTFLESKDGELYDDKILIMIKFICSVNAFRNSKLKSFINFKTIQIIDYLDLDFIYALYNIFNTLLFERKSLVSKQYEYYYNMKEQFKNIINLDLSEKEYLHNFSFFNYILTEAENKNYDHNARLFFNLIENSVYNNEYDKDKANFHTAIGMINSIQNTNDVYSNFKNLQSYGDGFSKLQFEEEKLKIRLLGLNSEQYNWKEVIESLEQHKYFRGRIYFIFSFINQNTNNISDSDFNDFKILGQKISIFFNENGLIKFKDHLLERALLCYGDYLINLSKKDHYSFLYDGDAMGIKPHLIPTWRRYLSWDYYFNKRQTIIFKELIESIHFKIDKFSKEDIEKTLQEIIDQKRDTVKDWRYLFIVEPKLFEYFETLNFIQSGRNNNKSVIYLTKNNKLESVNFLLYFIYLKINEKFNIIKYEIKNSDKIKIEFKESLKVDIFEEMTNNENGNNIFIVLLEKEMILSLNELHDEYMNKIHETILEIDINNYQNFLMRLVIFLRKFKE